ncbi:MAG TPA: glycosyltransferase family 4 protein [Bacteroidia bacterium]|nr:glycosyltransferase family 4 protein [Bacteroidia bacterium]HNU34782.1 glycosyltransferase family 4 protein [Bacteroidia bacterium]
MSIQKLLIAYITIEDPTHKHSWSGTNYYIMQSLRKHIGDVEIFGPVKPFFILFFLRAINFLTLKLFSKRFDYRHSVFLSKVYGRMLTRKLNKKKYDLIIAPTGNALLAYVKTSVPMVYIGDRTVKGAYNYHEQFRNLFTFSFMQSAYVDSLTLHKSAMISFPSVWAAQSAVAEYGVPDAKVKMIPFGANFDIAPPPNNFKRKKEDPIKLLFTGVNWKDKGGDIAFETLLALEEAGVKSQLVVCGCNPPAHIKHPNLLVEGFLNKEDSRQHKKLINHFRTADFFILPTRFEAYGLVFCEAAAYSVPVLATRTGGIPTIVIENETGFLFKLSDRGKVYADKICEVISSYNLMAHLKLQSYNRYNNVLNWDSWAYTFKKELYALNLLQRNN